MVHIIPHWFCPHLGYDFGDNDKEIFEFLNLMDINKKRLRLRKISVFYPSISGSNKDVVTNINNSIMNSEVELLKIQFLKNGKARLDKLFETYEIMLNQEGMLSIFFSVYTHAQKTDFGTKAYSSLTLNTQTGKIYNFNDIFDPNTDYMNFINKIAEDCTGRRISIDKNQKYYLTPDDLVLYYDINGLTKINIPYDKIKNIIVL